MPRRGRPERRSVLADARYNSEQVSRLINRVMLSGKKSLAERIVYQSFELVERQTNRPPLEVYLQAFRNVTPMMAVRPRRVGGATYQVPMEMPAERGRSTALKWLITAARARKGRPMFERLAAEIMDAARGQGAAARRRDETHRMAEANRAFAHYRW
ncbi:MAG TPA: 30S ribosomal protein S7 [Dehalococcoidia bacterium]|nr:30S ribosomal protein S7 [Dehalococcoidia bacterium]